MQKRCLPTEWKSLGLALGWMSLTLAAQAQSFGPAVQYAAAPNGSLYAVALGDVNGDGRPDIVTADFGQDNVLVLSGQVGGTFGAASPYANTTGGAPTSVAVGDVTGDGIADVVVGNTFKNNLGVLPGRPTGGPGPLVTYSTSVGSTSSTPRGVAIGDVNNDGRPDLVAALDNTNTAGVLLGQVGGGFAPMSAYSVGAGASPYALALSDLNGDGRLDILTANRGTNTVAVLLGQASGGFGAASTYPAGASTLGATADVAAGDLNGDGRPDIVVANNANAGVLLALAGGGFAPAATYQTGAPVTSVTLGDVTGDGRLDLITTGETIVGLSWRGAVAVLPGQASGTFGAAQSFTISSTANAGPIDAALRDLNGDGRLDIVTANYSPGTVSVLLNTGTYLAASSSALADVAIYPNPAQHGFTVRLPAGLQAASAKVELLNQLGQVMGELAVGPGTSFAVATDGLAPGSYLLQLTLPTGVVRRRVVLR